MTPVPLSDEAIAEIEAKRAAYAAEQERKRLEQQAKNKVVDDRLATADDLFRKINEIHERNDWSGRCTTCEDYEYDEVPVEERCQTISAIYCWMVRNEAVMAYRAAQHNVLMQVRCDDQRSFETHQTACERAD